MLRAGVGMLDGFLALVSGARVGFIGLFRDEETLEPVEYYVKLPEPTSPSATRSCSTRCSRPATRRAAAITAIKKEGARSVSSICLVAAPEGIERLHGEHPDVAHRHAPRSTAS